MNHFLEQFFVELNHEEQVIALKIITDSVEYLQDFYYKINNLEEEIKQQKCIGDYLSVHDTALKIKDVRNKEKEVLEKLFELFLEPKKEILIWGGKTINK